MGNSPSILTQDLVGSIALVTGATSLPGIGLCDSLLESFSETDTDILIFAKLGACLVQILSDRGCTIYMVARNTSRAEKVIQFIEEERKKNPAYYGGANNFGKINVIEADLGSIKNGVKKVLKECPDQIDYFVNAAALMPREINITEEHIENCVAVNYVAGFILTKKLRDRIRAKRELSEAEENQNKALLEQEQHVLDIKNRKGYYGGGILHIGAAAYILATFDRTDIEKIEGKNKEISGWDRYCNAKMLQHLGFYCLAKQQEGSTPRMVIVHPGVVSTELGREYGILYDLVKWAFTSPQKSAQFCVTALLHGDHGKYYDQQSFQAKPEKYKDSLINDENGDILMEWTEKWIHLADDD